MVLCPHSPIRSSLSLESEVPPPATPRACCCTKTKAFQSTAASGHVWELKSLFVRNVQVLRFFFIVLSTSMAALSTSSSFFFQVCKRCTEDSSFSSPHISAFLPYHSFPLSQRSSGCRSMPVSCKFPPTNLQKKSLFFHSVDSLDLWMTFRV